MASVDYLKYKTYLSYFTLFFLVQAIFNVFIHSFNALSENQNANSHEIERKPKIKSWCPNL